MAATKERIKIAQETAKAIDPIAQQIMKEWGLSFDEIQEAGKEPLFDREILKRVKGNSVANSLFQTSKRCTEDNYGHIWGCFSEEQQDIIALKETKLW